MEYALIVVEACAIFLSLGLCLATMDVPDRVNETNLNAYSTYLVFAPTVLM
jgi:hypothetical protein